MDDVESSEACEINAEKSKSNLLQKFWKLAEANDETRIVAAKDLLIILKRNQSEQGDGICEELHYSLQRLIRGLSSQRKAARLGFYITLCQLFKEFPVVTLGEILTLINKYLIVRGSKQEQSNLIIGQALAYGALIRSGRLSSNGEKIATVLSSLQLLEKQKAFTRPMITQLIVETFKQVKEKKFKKYLWPKLKDLVSAGWDNCTNESFMLLINIIETFPDVIDKTFLTDHWQTADIFASSNHSHISKLLIESTAEHPTINPVCFKLLHVAAKKTRFNEFWNYVIDEPLFGSRKDKVGFLGFEIAKEAVKAVQHPTDLGAIFSTNFLHLIISSTSNSHLFLNNAAMNICSFFVEYVKSTDNHEMQWQILKGICKEPSSLLFDRQSNTKTVVHIVMNLQPAALRKYFQLLKDKFLGKNHEQEVLREFIIKQIANLMTHPVILKDVDWRTEILQFLLFHAFFSIDEPVPEIPECEDVVTPLSDRLKQLSMNSFQHAVELLTKLGQRWRPHVISYLQVLVNLVKYADKLMNNCNVTFTNFDINEIRKTWTKTLNTISKLQKRGKMDTAPNSALNSFQVLYLYLLLQLFISPNKSVDIIEEVEECCNRALKKQQKKSARLTKKTTSENEVTEPDWVNVIIDILLSMLSQGNKLARTVVDNVFCLICPYMTEEALQQIHDVLKTTSEDSPLEADEEETSDAESSENEEAVEKQNEPTDAENQELRTKVFEALGPAVDDGNDEEGGEEAYFDDDTMFKLDNALAEAFRSMKKPKQKKFSEKDETLMNFKLRCLDLLNILIQVKPKPNLILKMILPVVSTIKVAVKHPKFQKTLVDKCVSCLEHLCKLKKFPDDKIDEDMLLELLTTLLKKTSYVTATEINKTLTNCCLFVMFCNRKHEVDSPTVKKQKPHVPWYMPVLKVSMEKFFTEKNCHLQSNLFIGVLARNRSTGWIFHKTVQRYVFNADVRLYKRTEGLNLLGQIIRCGERPCTELSGGNVSTQIQEKEWECLCGIVQKSFLKNLKESREPEIKPRHISAMLRALYAILDVNSKLFEHDIFESTEKNEIVDELINLPLRKLEKESRKCLNKCVHILSGKAISEVRSRKRKISTSQENEEPKSKSKMIKIDVNNN